MLETGAGVCLVECAVGVEVDGVLRVRDGDDGTLHELEVLVDADVLESHLDADRLSQFAQEGDGGDARSGEAVSVLLDGRDHHVVSVGGDGLSYGERLDRFCGGEGRNLVPLTIHLLLLRQLEGELVAVTGVDGFAIAVMLDTLDAHHVLHALGDAWQHDGGFGRAHLYARPFGRLA